MNTPRRLLLLPALLIAAAACGAQSSGGSDTTTAQLGLSSAPAIVPTTPPVIVTDPASTGAVVDQIAVPMGDHVGGNRVIMIGDSVLAGTAKRYSGAMCEALVPLDWVVEIDAEVGRFVEFGNEVLDDRLSAGWDMMVVLLGNNTHGDKGGFKFEVQRMINRVAPAPVLLINTTVRKGDKLMNEAIAELAAENPQRVLLLDWAAITKADRDLTGSDHLHPTAKGQLRLAAEVAAMLGRAPVSPGSCLSTDYSNDSAGTGGGGGGGGGGATTTTTDAGTTTTEATATTTASTA